MKAKASACTPEPAGNLLALLLMGMGSSAFAVLLIYVLGDDVLGYWWIFLEVILSTALILVFVWLGPRRLGYRATPSRLYIRTFVGASEVLKGRILRVRLIQYSLDLKIIGSEFPGYYVGSFRSNLGSMQAFVSRKRGRGVLLELEDGRKPVINPRNPRRCLEPLHLRWEKNDE